MTGFRLALGGAQEFYNVNPDMTTMGKIIGGGLPVGAYGGKKEIMDYVSTAVRFTRQEHCQEIHWLWLQGLQW